MRQEKIAVRIRCGIWLDSPFNRVFLDKIGMSPTEYMKQEPQGILILRPEFP